MDLAQKIGQLFLLGFQGHTLSPNDTILEDITRRNLGGVLLFERLLAKKLADNNIINPSQVKKLTSQLQEASPGKLFIATDQEGGKVSRLSAKRGFPKSPMASEIGNNASQDKTLTQATATAKLLTSLGINLNLAPVVDVNSYSENPIIGKLGRSFSSDPSQVSNHARAWIHAHKLNNVRTCIKHFPGHGSSKQDSHLGFVDVTDTWHKDELIPFQELISTGDVEAIMTGHLFNRNLDPDFPATISFKTLTELLREELDFQGVIMSDDMQMKAITDKYGLEQAICKALASGVDLIIIGNNLSYDEKILSKAIEAVLRGVDNQVLTEKGLNRAFERVQHFKNS